LYETLKAVVFVLSKTGSLPVTKVIEPVYAMSIISYLMLRLLWCTPI